MVVKRNRNKQTRSLEERLQQQALDLRTQAKLLQPGAVQRAVIRKAGEIEAACNMTRWLRSPSLQPEEEREEVAG